MDETKIMKELFHNKENMNLALLLNGLHCLFQYFDTQSTHSITSDIVDVEFIEEIKSITDQNEVDILFGETLRDLKCVMKDNEGLREHEIFVKYKGPKKLVISHVNLPHTPMQDKEYSSIKEIVTAFKKQLSSLEGYFTELENIDRVFTVTEPLNPTLKDNYRVVFLDDRVWLYIEVTPGGLATNVHLIGQSEKWGKQLHRAILAWNHNVDIVENVTTILGENLFLYDGVPLPLCSSTNCGAYFHRYCLFQWLLASSGGRSQYFGIVTGTCPNCFEIIACCEKD